MKAVEVIMEHGVPEDRIIFLNLVRPVLYHCSISLYGLCRRVQISSPQGLKTFFARYPLVKVVSHLSCQVRASVVLVSQAILSDYWMD